MFDKYLTLVSFNLLELDNAKLFTYFNYCHLVTFFFLGGDNLLFFNRLVPMSICKGLNKSNIKM